MEGKYFHRLCGSVLSAVSVFEVVLPVESAGVDIIFAIDNIDCKFLLFIIALANAYKPIFLKYYDEIKSWPRLANHIH